MNRNFEKQHLFEKKCNIVNVFSHLSNLMRPCWKMLKKKDLTDPKLLNDTVTLVPLHILQLMNIQVDT